MKKSRRFVKIKSGEVTIPVIRFNGGGFRMEVAKGRVMIMNDAARKGKLSYIDPRTWFSVSPSDYVKKDGFFSHGARYVPLHGGL